MKPSTKGGLSEGRILGMSDIDDKMTLADVVELYRELMAEGTELSILQAKTLYHINIKPYRKLVESRLKEIGDGESM